MSPKIKFWDCGKIEILSKSGSDRPGDKTGDRVTNEMSPGCFMGWKSRIATKFARPIQWAGALWTLLGWLGFTSIVTTAVAGFIGPWWAIATGIPLPISLMAGFCVLAAGAGFVLLVLIYRLLRAVTEVRAVPELSQTTQNPPLPKPNYAAWKLHLSYTISEASILWMDIEPAAERVTTSCVAWRKTFVSLAQQGILQIDLHRSPDARHKSNIGRYTYVTRDSLRKFAETQKSIPQFLWA